MMVEVRIIYALASSCMFDLTLVFVGVLVMANEGKEEQSYAHINKYVRDGLG